MALSLWEALNEDMDTWINQVAAGSFRLEPNDRRVAPCFKHLGVPNPQFNAGIEKGKVTKEDD